ncbi:Pectate lyase [Hirschfeldia incana]|nr:Pectate lyase [Hirschfeldia incana]
MFRFLTLTLIQVLIVLFVANVLDATELNVMDKCWRPNPHWRKTRNQLARCSVGFAGKMTGNIGKGVAQYKVTDPSDDPLNPKPGTLRYGATLIKGKKWITFKRNMKIKLHKPLLISSFTTLDGRGVSVHLAGPGCLIVYKATDVIIHGLKIHDCKAHQPSSVMGQDSKIIQLGKVDGDAIRLVTAKKVWIDHNTLYDCEDGLLDVTRGSTDVTVSNNWFRNQDKVMLLGHDDGYVRDKDMRVTVVFNHFGPNCNQRMPRVRYGYAHVANNYYQGWTQYAIGGSMSPRVKSESNYFVAPKSGRKEITWKKQSQGDQMQWKFYSVNDYFENGACFGLGKGIGKARPNYGPSQRFTVANAKNVKKLTSSAGALHCTRNSVC